MTICQATLVGANGRIIKQEKITVPALTKLENGDFLVDKYQASPFQIILLNGRAKLPAKNYCFHCGSFFMRDMLFHCDVNRALTIKLVDTTVIYVNNKTGNYNQLPTHEDQYFQIQAGDTLVKGSVISIDPYYDANMSHLSNDGFFLIDLD